MGSDVGPHFPVERPANANLLLHPRMQDDDRGILKERGSKKRGSKANALTDFALFTCALLGRSALGKPEPFPAANFVILEGLSGRSTSVGQVDRETDLGLDPGLGPALGETWEHDRQTGACSACAAIHKVTMA